jgi:hypothetical protein
MVFPLIPIFVSSASSLLAASSGWAFMKIKEIDSKLAWITATTRQLQISSASAQSGTIWSELLEPLAKEWSVPLSRLSYSLCAVSVGVLFLGFGAWFELRMFRFEMQRLREENERLLKILANSNIPLQ